MLVYSSLASQPLPSELLLLHNHRGKGLIRLDRFLGSCGMCGIWRHWLQLLCDTWVHWKDRSSAPLRTPNDCRSLPSASFEHVTSELVEDSCQERSLRSTIPTQYTNDARCQRAVREVLNSRHMQVKAAPTKFKFLPISIECRNEEDISPVLYQRGSLTASTLSYNLIDLPTFLQRTQKPVEPGQILLYAIA